MLASKLQAAWLLIALLFGQVHACASGWVLPDGTPCKSCPAGPCKEDPSPVTREGADPSIGLQSDCHSCCVQQACSDPEKHGKSSNTAQPPHFDVAFIRADIVQPTCLAVDARAVHVEIESGFPNAPPGCSSSRAPPVSLS